MLNQAAWSALLFFENSRFLKRLRGGLRGLDAVPSSSGLFIGHCSSCTAIQHELLGSGSLTRKSFSRKRRNFNSTLIWFRLIKFSWLSLIKQLNCFIELLLNEVLFALGALGSLKLFLAFDSFLILYIHEHHPRTSFPHCKMDEKLVWFAFMSILNALQWRVSIN